MKSPLHFKNFIKNLFKYENSELVVNTQYIEKVNIQNSQKMGNEPILCYLNYTSVEAFKIDYDRDIANNNYFDVIFEQSSNSNLVANLNVLASFEQNHTRQYIIPIERLKEYIQLNNIIKKIETNKKIELEIKDDKINNRFNIMEIE